jgi:hypothetical protein
MEQAMPPDLTNEQLITLASSSLNLVLMRIMVEALEGMPHPPRIVDQLATARDILTACKNQVSP